MPVFVFCLCLLGGCDWYSLCFLFFVFVMGSLCFFLCFFVVVIGSLRFFVGSPTRPLQRINQLTVRQLVPCF